HVSDGDGGARNHGLALVGDGAGDGPTVGLSEDSSSAQKRDRDEAIHRCKPLSKPEADARVMVYEYGEGTKRKCETRSGFAMANAKHDANEEEFLFALRVLGGIQGFRDRWGEAVAVPRLFRNEKR